MRRMLEALRRRKEHVDQNFAIEGRRPWLIERRSLCLRVDRLQEILLIHDLQKSGQQSSPNRSMSTNHELDRRERTWTTAKGLIPSPNMNKPIDIKTTFSKMSPNSRITWPSRIAKVAKTLVLAVPSLVTIKPPIRGVQVLFRSKAAIINENSALEVPISRDKRDLRGPRK